MIKQLVAALAVVLISSAAQAHNHRHYRHHHHQPNHRTIDKLPTVGRSSIISCDQYGCRGGQSKRTTERPIRQARHYSSGRGVIGGRRAGFPYAFCGAEASYYVFGVAKRELWLAANWMWKFHRAPPAPGMAAARPGHVFILIRYIAGNDWLVHDGNSGHHQTREHVRSIRGYVIVNPHSARYSSR